MRTPRWYKKYGRSDGLVLWTNHTLKFNQNDLSVHDFGFDPDFCNYAYFLK